MHVEHTIHIDAPPAVVWETTIDLDRWPEWTPTVHSVRRLDAGPLGVGSVALLRQPGLPEARWVVTALAPGSRFGWETRVRAMHFVASHFIEPEGDGTRNTLSVAATGWPLRLLGPILERKMAAALQAENSGLKAWCESRGGGGPETRAAVEAVARAGAEGEPREASG